MTNDPNPNVNKMRTWEADASHAEPGMPIELRVVFL